MESRRANMNISHLTLSPITTRMPVDDDDQGADMPTPWVQRTSYISGRSAPSTPKLLSRSSSRTRLDRTASTKLAGSKSYTNLSSSLAADTGRKRTTTTHVAQFHGPIQPLSRRRKDGSRSSNRLSQSEIDNGEWLFRAGTAISSETRESKGQSWLVSRDSSTSLVAQRDEDEDTTDDNGPNRRRESIASARASRTHSRTQSRAASAKTSRRGSRIGTRPDLSYLTTPMRTPMDGKHSRAMSREEMTDYFGVFSERMEFAGPDFVEDEDFGDQDGGSDDEIDEEEERKQEDEIRQLANDRGIGMGSVVNRFLGWTLFDAEETETEEEAVSRPAQKKKKALAQPEVALKLKDERREGLEANKDAETASLDKSQAWSDAAWLLSVASKVLL